VVPEGAVGRRVILPHPLESGASICHSARLAAHLSVRGSERRRIVVARSRFMRRDNNTQATRKLAVGVHGRALEPSSLSDFIDVVIHGKRDWL